MKKILIFAGLCLFINTSFAVNNTENIEIQQLQHRIYMLEVALSPSTPEAVAAAWANAIKSRNGAVQYMLMCPDLQKTNLANLKTLNWVTGVSSPWISEIKVTPQKNKLAFNIQYQFSDSSGKVGTIMDQIKMIKINPQINSNSSQQWCISQFGSLSPVDKL